MAQPVADAPLHQVEVVPIPIGDRLAVGFRVELPKTRLVAISTGKGYIMCGALDVSVLDTRLADRRVVAGRAFGVRTFQDLLAKPLAEVTAAARALGVEPGMTGQEALACMF